MVSGSQVYRSRMNWCLFGTLCGMEGSLVIAMLMLYRLTYKPTLFAFLLSRPGVIFCGALMGVVLFGRATVRTWDHGTRKGASSGLMTLVLHGIFVIVAYTTVECTLRVLAVPQIWGEEVHGKLLLPRGWNMVVERYTRILDGFEKQGSYYVEDPLLGWSIGANRTSADGLSHSSAEGFRSAKPGMSYGESSSCHVALVGDSFTFGDEAKFEETWNYYLQQKLGAECQVTNFGVPGYSIGQMYLRLKRDVLPRKPDLIILGFTNGAPDRTLGIYCFLMMLDWDQCPWVAPRFVLKGEQPVVVNAPLPHPREVYATKAIRELPFIAYDRWYRTAEWEQPYWEPLYASYVFRLLTTLNPIYSVIDPQVSDEARRTVNGALFKSIRTLTDENGAELLVVYLPMMEDYGYKVRYRAPESHRILNNVGINFIDNTACLAEMEEQRRFLSVGVHYTPETALHIAQCLLPHVLNRLPSGVSARIKRNLAKLQSGGESAFLRTPSPNENDLGTKE